ncbi:hypothetical protein BaRGS_00025976, partial [Batillaria attramentaria]
MEQATQDYQLMEYEYASAETLTEDDDRRALIRGTPPPPDTHIQQDGISASGEARR